jgi:hypothetical protein
VTVSGCGGGGLWPSEEFASSPPVSLAPPPAPPPAAPPPPTGESVRPVLFIEKDNSGAAFLRVEEQIYNAFSPGAAQREIRDRKLGPAPGVNTVIEGDQTTDVENVDAVQLKYGLTLQASSMVSIYDYTYTQFNGGGSIFGGAIKLGDNDRPTNGSTYIQRVAADGMQQPDSTYKVSNNDFLGVELDSGPIYVRDVTGKNFGDAGVDTKSTQVYIMNATFEGAHRMLRAWPGVEIIVVNSIINAAPGHSQGWVYDSSSTIRYYNTLWCVGSANPSPSDPKCTSNPTVVEGENLDPATAASRFIALQSNPLPAINGFFASKIDQIAIEYSADGGRTWNALQLPNTGKAGLAPIGDPRYRIPLDLNAADYRFRATYMKNGVKAGNTSQPIDETGNVSS